MITIQPMQWSRLQDLHDGPNIDASVAASMEEVRDVLARHGKLQQFALHLAHRLFNLGPREVLIEHPNQDGRIKHVTVAYCARQERDLAPSSSRSRATS